MRLFKKHNIAAFVSAMNYALRTDGRNIAIVAEIRDFFLRVLLAELTNLAVGLVNGGEVLGSLCPTRPALGLHASSRLLRLELLLVHGRPHPRQVNACVLPTRHIVVLTGLCV